MRVGSEEAPRTAMERGARRGVRPAKRGMRADGFRFLRRGGSLAPRGILDRGGAGRNRLAMPKKNPEFFRRQTELPDAKKKRRCSGHLCDATSCGETPGLLAIPGRVISSRRSSSATSLAGRGGLM